MYKSVPINLILANQEKPQWLLLATEHLAFSLLGSRDEVTLAKERSLSPMERKRCSTRQMRGRGTQPACQCQHQPWNQQQPDSLSSHKHLQTTFPSKTLKARGAGEKTENLSIQGRALASIFSRMIAPEKLHYGHSSKVGKGAHLHKGFQQWNLTRSTKSN